MKRLSAPCGPASTRADDAALDVPAFSGVADVAVAADLFTFARNATEGGVLGEWADLAQQHRIAGEAEDVTDALALAKAELGSFAPSSARLRSPSRSEADNTFNPHNPGDGPNKKITASGKCPKLLCGRAVSLQQGSHPCVWSIQI